MSDLNQPNIGQARSRDLAAAQEPLIVQTTGSGDDMELVGANVPEGQLAFLLAQPGVLHARNQHGATVELSLDMDYDTPVVRPVAAPGAGDLVAALASHTPFPADPGAPRPLASTAADAAASASLAAAWRAALNAAPAERVAVAGSHPQLARAFALEAAAASFAKRGLQPESRLPFLSGIRRNIEADLSEGRPIAEVRVRDRAKVPTRNAIAEH